MMGARRLIDLDEDGLRALMADELDKRATATEDVLGMVALCEWLDLSQPTVLKLVKEQGFPGAKLGRDWRFIRSDVLRWMRAQGKEAPKE